MNNPPKKQQEPETVEQLMAARAHLRPSFLATAKSDQLVDAILRLTMEVCVIRDRLDIYEALFSELGIESNAIENFIADAETRKKRSERTQLLVKKIAQDLGS